MKTKRASAKSRETWLTIINDFLKSDISMELFCQKRDLGIVPFKTWYAHFHKKKGCTTSPTIKSSAFIPVKMSTPSMVPHFNIELPNGIKLDIANIEDNQLQTILRICCNVVNG